MSTTPSQSFMDNNKNVNEDDAMSLVVKAQQEIRKLEKEREDDDKLAAARQIVKDLGAGYSAAIKYEKAKISFLLDKLEEIQSNEVNPTSSLRQ